MGVPKVIISKILWCAVLIYGIPFFASADITFSDMHVWGNDQLLFMAAAQAPSMGSYKTAFAADLPSGSLTQLSAYPERLTRAPGSNVVRVHNRFGLFQLNSETGVFTPEEGFPSFVAGDEIVTGKTAPVSSSPDGTYLVYLKSTSPAHAELIFYDSEQNRHTVLARDVPMQLNDDPVRWNPDGSVLIYSDGNAVFYFSIEQYRRGRVSEREMRRLGPGTVASVEWGRSGSLYYVAGTLVYRIRPNELFARTIYEQVLQIGDVAGKLPFSFDSNFDAFTVAPDGEKLLFTKSQRSVFLMYLQRDDYYASKNIISLPYLHLPRSTRIAEVVWSVDDIITVLATAMRNGSVSSTVFRAEIQSPTDHVTFERIEQEGVLGMMLDRRQERILVRTADAVEVRDYSDWSLLYSYDYRSPLHALWLNDTQILAVDEYVYETIDTVSGKRTWAGFAQPERMGVSVESLQPIISGSGYVQLFNGDSGEWFNRDSFRVREPALASDRYRVYLENQPASSRYRNLIMQREVGGVGTRPLFPRPQRQYEAFPDLEEEIDMRVFSHGSRIRRREIALVFNAVDDVEGLTEILHVLHDYDIQATFFVNGIFLSRNPQAVRIIAEAGHEVGNLFHAYFDMTDSSFRITRDYIQQGLSRTADSYFLATGQELSLLWHAPYYYVSSQILEAAEEINYQYVSRDVDALDWVTKGAQDGQSGLYQRSPALIERIIDQKKPGSIISMRVGVPEADQLYTGRDDYLFQYLDVLVNALLDKGYSFVPVSTLKDRIK